MHEFVAVYPPEAVARANPKPALRSTRTVLDAPRPLVRLVSPAELPDDTVPPMLTFPELELLLLLKCAETGWQVVHEPRT